MPRKYALAVIALLTALCAVLIYFALQHEGDAKPESETEVSADIADTSAEPAETEPVTEAVTTEAESTAETEPADTAPVYTREELEALDNSKNGYGQGLSVDEYNRPYGALNAQAAYGEYGGKFIESGEEKIIYLTFDLGYENGYTARILDTLKEKGVSATFFATMEYCEQSPDIVRRIVDEGHTLGNHSVHHRSMPTLSIDDMEAEIMGLHSYIKETYGYEMHLFRPPMGEYSCRSLALAKSLGYSSVNWSFAYYDYDVNKQPERQAAIDRITGAAHSGAIYLLHAVSKTNTEVLGEVIDSFRAQGYELKALS